MYDKAYTGWSYIVKGACFGAQENWCKFFRPCGKGIAGTCFVDSENWCKFFQLRWNLGGL